MSGPASTARATPSRGVLLLLVLSPGIAEILTGSTRRSILFFGFFRRCRG
ncbi:MAG: hypothetical protein ACRECR_03100 [Thermoplasmata archaeon]